MGWLFGSIAGLFSRLGVSILWPARPAPFGAAFGGFWLWPVLGIIVLPFTTLINALVWTPGVGLAGLDWLWVILAAGPRRLGKQRLRQPGSRRPAARLIPDGPPRSNGSR